MHKEQDFKDTRTRLEEEGFAVKPCTFANERCWLIFAPNMGIEWTKDNMIYRSSIWNDSGQPVSLSWKKFFNWDEQCELAPKPENIEDCELIAKEDGSTFLVSMYKGQLITRTRGSTDISMLDNGYEKEFLLQKYKVFFDNFCIGDTSNCTYVFEWETPNNKIVLDYGPEPRLVLTGIIEHYDYGYMLTYAVDAIAALYELERPKKYKFNDFDSMQSAMKSMKGVEGIVVYHNNDQDIKKMKTDEYLMLHSCKYKLGYKALIELIYEENTGLDKFKEYIEKRFDFEGLQFIENLIDDIYIADIKLKNSIINSWELIMRHEPKDKKDFALLVFGGSINKEYAPFMFKLYESDRLDVRNILMSNASMCTKFKKMVLDEVNDD